MYILFNLGEKSTEYLDVSRARDVSHFPWISYLSSFALLFILYPATAGHIPETKSQMRKMKPTKIAVRALDFGISPETSYRSIIHGDMGSWLPWCVSNVQFPHVLRSGQSKKWKVEYLRQYTTEHILPSFGGTDGCAWRTRQSPSQGGASPHSFRYPFLRWGSGSQHPSDALLQSGCP